MTEPTIQSKATEALTFFEYAERYDGTMFWKLKENRPEWLYDAAYAAHDGFLPDDFKYEFLMQSFTAIAETRSDHVDDIELEPSCYNKELLDWLGSNLERAGYCDQAQSDGLVSDDCDMFQRIAAGQYIELREVLTIVLSHLSDEVDRCIDDTEAAQDREDTEHSLMPGKV